MKFAALKDTREKNGGWFFPPSDSCEGTTIKTLKTGDYTLRGFEETFIVERKKSTSEWAKNIIEERFERELERLDEFESPFIVCEFTMSDIIRFPYNSGIPKYKWKGLRITSEYMLKRTLEIQLAHKAKLIFAGTDGYHVCWSLFKRVQDAASSPT